MRIGIVGYERSEIFGVHIDYLNFVEKYGTPVIIPPVSRKDFFKTYRIEGLVLPGGMDVDWRRYASVGFWSDSYDPILEHFDREILPGIFHAGFPVFGICRGLQTLNVHFGGNLWQHLWKHPTNKAKNTFAHEVFDVDTGEGRWVNSFHHQCIWKLGQGIVPLARTRDCVIEAIRHETLPIYAVQYHPERMEDSWTDKVMRLLFS